MKSENIVAVKDNVGEVKLIKHSGKNMETALVEDMVSVNAKGTTCILTNTNEEALLILGVLRQKNIPTKLIQSMGELGIYDIAEIRYFLKSLNNDITSPVISNEQWERALDELQEKYHDSTCMPVINNILHTFNESNEKKYRTDFEMFLRESKIEDFYTEEKDVVTISTMHKSKGREIDNVYMLINKVDMRSDEDKRKLYVGMTRAKKLLHIHYFSDEFDIFTEYASTDEVDLHNYPKPSELILQLSHKDVFLDFFKDKKNLILDLRSGMHLQIRSNRLYIQKDGKLLPVLQFSKKSYEDIKKYSSLGYTLYDAVIRFICAWRGKEYTDESAIILADLYFRTNQ